LGKNGNLADALLRQDNVKFDWTPAFAGVTLKGQTRIREIFGD
jgi:hypothetical protein